MKVLNIQGFGGAFTSVDPREITASGNASDMLNVRVEDRAIATRYGFRSIAAAQGTFDTAIGPKGLEYLSGYTSALAATEEYVSFERLSADAANKVRPFSRHVTTGAATAITNGGATLTLHASDWVGRVFGSSAYFVNPNETNAVKRYTLGTTTSWKDVAAATSPATRASYTVLYGGSAGYSYLNFYNGGTSIQTGDVTYTGIGSATGFAANTDGSLTIGHNGSSPNGDASFTVDVKSRLSNQDLSYNDIFYFTIQGVSQGWSLDPTSVQVQVVNDDGSPLTFYPIETKCVMLSQQLQGAGTMWGVRVEFLKSDGTQGSDRAGWDNIRKLVVSYHVISNSGTKLIMSKWTKGGVWIPESRNPVLPRDAIFTYSYYYSANQFESGLCTSLLTVPYAVLDGGGVNAPFPTGLGVHLRLTLTTSADSNVDNNRLYMKDTADNTWRLVVTQSDASATYDYKISYAQFHAFTAYSSVTPFKTDQCVSLCPFKGWMVWFYQGGASSVRHSQVGNAERQASDLDDALTDTDPPTRGATFSMPGQQDEPLGGVEAGDTLLIPGSYGVYAQIGTAPAYMTPPKRVAGSFGVANKFAFCRWRDDNGNPGMAYVSREGQVYFVTVSPQFTGDAGAFVNSLSTPIYTGGMSVATFLRNGQSLTTLDTLRVGVDEATDSLWVVMGKRALVLRRPHPETGTPRQWEAYEYNVGTVTYPYLAFSTRRWLKSIDSAGQFVEFDRNSSSGANITGTLRDNGAAVGTPYWQSGTYVTPNVRVAHVLLERDTLTNTPTLTVTSTRQASSVTATSGKSWVRFGALQQGRNHVFKIALGENDDALRRIEAHLFAAGSRLTS